MSLTEEVDENFEHSMVKADAGCTPKLSRRKTVANDCGKSVTEILSKRSPGVSRRSRCSSSWLRVVRKSSITVKNIVESRNKVYCSRLQFDAAPFHKVLEYSGCHLSADSKSAAVSPCHENKITSSPVQVNVFDWHCVCIYDV